MKKYILLYNGPATPPEKMSEEQRNKVMEDWKVWMQKAGDALVDFGQPMVGVKSLKDNGESGTLMALSGYSIIQAKDLDTVHELVSTHPFLSDSDGKFSIDTYELLPAPGM